MVLPDDHHDKWKYTPTTRQKHRILRAYIWPWASKITSFTDHIRTFDCFAGRGSYPSGVEGLDLNHLDLPIERPDSPLLLLDRIIDFGKKVDEENRIGRLDLACIEDNPHNYNYFYRKRSLSLRGDDYLKKGFQKRLVLETFL